MLAQLHVIAHRGASGYAPENTLSAFQKAEALGATWIECDVQASADGELFMFHDDTLNRTTNGRGEFAKTTSQVLRTLDAGAWFSSEFKHEKILPFKEALVWFAARKIKANIEIKASSDRIEETTLSVLREINRYWPDNRRLPVISSFNPNALRLCAKLVPDLPRALLFDRWQEDILALAQEIDCVSINLSASITNIARLNYLKDHGYAVCVYTVNRKKDVRQYLKWGVDAVFSNYPDILIKPSYLTRLSQQLNRLYVNVFKKNLDKTERVA